jgi:DNA-binding transcriptional MerR regulator
MHEAAPQPEAVEIPNKLYFRIGEVSSMLGLEPHVLRFWETEFGSLSPKKSGTGHRLYRRKDVELLLKIKHLLYEKRYTIEGARQMLQAGQKLTAKPARQQGLFAEDPLPEIRKELAAILEILR